MSFGGMLGGADLQILMTLKDEASRAMGGVGQNAGKMSQNIKRGAAIAGIAIVGIGVAATKMASDFEKGMNQVATLLPGARDVVQGLSDDVLKLSKTYGIDAVEATEALYQAISLGVPPANVMNFMQLTAKAAVGGVVDLESAVVGIQSIVNAYGADVITAAEASDTLFTAVRLGGTTFEEMEAALFQVVPTAASLGISFDEVGAAMATMTAKGLPTATATTQLRQLFVEAAKSGTKLDLALRDLAGKGFGELIGEGGTASGILQILRDSMPAQEFRDLFGSVEAFSAALLQTGGNAGQMNDFLDEMAGKAGATGEAFDVMASGSAFAFDKAKASMKAAMIELGTAILPVVTKMAEGFSFLISVITDLPGPFKFAILAFGGLIAVAGLLLPVIGFLVPLFGALAAVLPILAAAFTILLGPVGLVVLAIAGVVAVGVLIIKNWNAIQRAGRQVWDGIKRAVTDLGRAFAGLGDGIRATFDGAIQKVKDFFGFIAQIPARIRTAVANMPLIGGITQGISRAVGGFRSFAGNFERGGVVPGALGSPQLILAHGGEEVRTRAQQGGVTVQIINQATIVHDRDFRDLVVEALEIAERQGRR